MDVCVTEEDTRQTRRKKKTMSAHVSSMVWQTEVWGFKDNQLPHMKLHLATSILWFLFLLYLMCGITQYTDIVLMSVWLPSPLCLYWLFSCLKCVNVFLSSTEGGHYMFPDTGTPPHEAEPHLHRQSCCILEILDWIGIWGVSRPGMSIWALCHVFQMVFVLWWGKLPNQAGVVCQL